MADAGGCARARLGHACTYSLLQHLLNYFVNEPYYVTWCGPAVRANARVRAEYAFNSLS